MPIAGRRISACGYCHESQSFWLKINVQLSHSLQKVLVHSLVGFEHEACQYQSNWNADFKIISYSSVIQWAAGSQTAFGRTYSLSQHTKILKNSLFPVSESKAYFTINFDILYTRANKALPS